MDIDNGFFMVKFILEEGKDKVALGGPWMNFNHYLFVLN